MRRPHLDRRDHRATRRTLSMRFRHTDRLTGTYLPAPSPTPGGLR